MSKLHVPFTKFNKHPHVAEYFLHSEDMSLPKVPSDWSNEKLNGQQQGRKYRQDLLADRVRRGRNLGWGLGRRDVRETSCQTDIEEATRTVWRDEVTSHVIEHRLK